MICHNFDFLILVHSDVTPTLVFFNNCHLTIVRLIQFENNHFELADRFIKFAFENKHRFENFFVLIMEGIDNL